MTDVGYFKGLAYVVMHLMPDPMQVKSCVLKDCIEADNQACSHTGADHECLNTEIMDAEWSDLTAFFQFGFRLRTGIVTKTYHDVHTSDWVGPYNMILAPIEKQGLDEDSSSSSSSNPLEGDQKNLFVSRYVNTPFTKTSLQRPFANSGIFNFDPEILEDVVGLKAINETIHEQIQWRGTPKAERQDSLLRGQAKNDDPYSKYARTCAHGDLHPILPKLEVVKVTHPAKGDNPPKHNFHMKVKYPILSLPKDAADPLYKLWPTMKSHLGPQFPLKGPYCYGKDPNRAYAIDLAYDSSVKPENSIWKGVKGCVAPWPCWSGDPHPPALPPSGKIPIDNNTDASYVLDPQGLEFMIVYAVGLLLVISLVFNCQLANKLKSLQQSIRARRDFDQVREANRSFGRQPSSNHTPATQPSQNRNPARGVSYSNYLREAVEGGPHNSLEEPLLTASTSDDTAPVDNTESTEGVEESKQEAE